MFIVNIVSVYCYIYKSWNVLLMADPKVNILNANEWVKYKSMYTRVLFKVLSKVLVKYMKSMLLSKYFRDNKNKHGIGLILKWEIFRRTPNYKMGDKICLLCMNKKLVMSFTHMLKNYFIKNLKYWTDVGTKINDCLIINCLFVLFPL